MFLPKGSWRVFSPDCYLVLQGDEGSFVSWGSSACPCVEKVQGSSLLPVRVERKITLLARNLHLYQVRLDSFVILKVFYKTTLFGTSKIPDFSVYCVRAIGSDTLHAFIKDSLYFLAERPTDCFI